jgi:hypothetical protein
LEKLARKAEAAALLEQETKLFAKKPPVSASTKSKKDNKIDLPFDLPENPMLMAAKKSILKKEAQIESNSLKNTPVPEYSASGIDAAIELLDVTLESSAGSLRQEDKLDRHPERRAKGTLGFPQ